MAVGPAPTLAFGTAPGAGLPQAPLAPVPGAPPSAPPQSLAEQGRRMLAMQQVLRARRLLEEALPVLGSGTDEGRVVAKAITVLSASTFGEPEGEPNTPMVPPSGAPAAPPAQGITPGLPMPGMVGGPAGV